MFTFFRSETVGLHKFTREARYRRRIPRNRAIALSGLLLAQLRELLLWQAGLRYEIKRQI